MRNPKIGIWSFLSEILVGASVCDTPAGPVEEYADFVKQRPTCYINATSPGTTPLVAPPLCSSAIVAVGPNKLLS